MREDQFQAETVYFKDYYSILGINHGATIDEVKKGFRAKVRKVHPDVAKGVSKEKAKELFILTREAYDVLSQPNFRRKYDKEYVKNVKDDLSSSVVIDDEMLNNNDSTVTDEFGKNSHEMYSAEWEVYYKDITEYLSIFHISSRSISALMLSVAGSVITSAMSSILIVLLISGSIWLGTAAASIISMTGIGFFVGVFVYVFAWETVTKEWYPLQAIKISTILAKSYSGVRRRVAINIIRGIQFLTNVAITFGYVYMAGIFYQYYINHHDETFIFFSLGEILIILYTVIGIVVVIPSYIMTLKVVNNILTLTKGKLPKPKFKKVTKRQKKKLRYKIKLLTA